MVYYMTEDKTASPEKPPVNSKINGDANGDGKFTVADVVMLQRYLLGEPGIELTVWQNADLYDDDIIDTFDLCIMKNRFLETL